MITTSATDRPRRWRRAAVLLIAVIGVAGAIAFGRHSTPIITDSDLAVGEVYVELATRGQLQVGAYSRFGWHHPGPLPFYLMAPFYAAAGHQAAALYSAAAVINLACLVALLWLLTRHLSGVAPAVILGASLVLIWRLNWFLASPWNAHIGVLPALVFIVVAAAIAHGRLQWWPLLVFAGSLAAQSHAGFVPLVVSVTAITLAAAFARASTRAAARTTAIRAFCFALVLWGIPLAEAVTNGGGNAASLWRFFVADAPASHSLSDTLRTGSYALLGIFRPDLDLPWGAHFDLQHMNWIVPAAIGEVAGLLFLVYQHARRGRGFDAWLAAFALVATAVCVLSLARVRGDILNHELLRLGAIGALNLGILTAAVVAPLEAWLATPAARPGLALFAGSLGLTVAATLAVRDVRDFTEFEIRRERGRIRGVEAYGAVREYLAAHGIQRPIIVVGADRYSEAAVVLLRLTQDGRQVAVDDDYVGMFSEHFRRTGDEGATLVFADLAEHRVLRERPGTTVLFQAMPLFVDVTMPAGR